MTEKKPTKKQPAKKQAAKKQPTKTTATKKQAPKKQGTKKTVAKPLNEPTKKPGRPKKATTSAAPTQPVINITTTATTEQILDQMQKLLTPTTPTPKPQKWHTKLLAKLNRRQHNNGK